MSIKIIKENCTGCEDCVNICPFGAIEMVNNTVNINEKCNKCGACVNSCPAEAIIL